MRKLFAASGVLFLLFLAMGAQNNKYFGDLYTGLTNAPGLMTDADGKLILGSGPGSPTGGVAVAQSASIITTTNGSVVSPSFSLSASNWIYSLTLGATNEALRHATSLTNGAINNLSNYVLTVSQNSTNQSLLLSLNNTNESLRQATSLTNGAINNLSNLVSTLSVNATNQSLKIGAAATNNDTLISISATNEALRQATALTNGAINNLSNYTLTISQNGTNQSLKIGGAATNNDVLMATGITNGLGAALSNYVSSAANAIARDTGTGTNTSVLIDQTGSFKVSQTNGGSLLLSASNNLVLANTNLTVNGVLTVNSGTNTDWISNMVATGWIVASNTVSASSFQGTVGTTNLAGTVADVNLANSAANTGTFGDSTHVAQVTVDTKGRVTAAANVSISGISGLPSGTNGGDMMAFHGGNWIVSPMGQYIFGGTTSTNGILTNLTTFGTGRSSLQLTNGYSVRIIGDFTAAGSTNSGAWTKTALFRNNAGTVSLIQSNQLTGPTTGNAANWNCQYAISGTNIQFQAVGDTNEFVTWLWQGFWELVTNATQTAAAPASLPSGAKIVLLASTVSGGDGTLSSASVPWLDQSGNHYDAYAVNPGGVYITNSSTHKEWHSKTAASGWFITNSAFNVLNNLTGATMICTFTAESTNTAGQLAFVNVSGAGSLGSTWLGQKYPHFAGQDSLDWITRRIATDSGQILLGPGVSRGARYTTASIVNWNAQTAATYTNGVLLSSVTGITGFGSGNTDSNASQGMTLMCAIISSGPTYGTSMTGSLANFVLYPFILTTNQIQQAATYLNGLP